MKVLVFNCGSSSLKFELLELVRGGCECRQIARGKFEEPRATALMTDASGEKIETSAPVDNHVPVRSQVPGFGPHGITVSIEPPRLRICGNKSTR